MHFDDVDNDFDFPEDVLERGHELTSNLFPIKFKYIHESNI